MFNRCLSGCRRFGVIDDISDMVSGQRPDISINPDLVGTLSILCKYKSGINSDMIAIMCEALLTKCFFKSESFLQAQLNNVVLISNGFSWTTDAVDGYVSA